MITIDIIAYSIFIALLAATTIYVSIKGLKLIYLFITDGADMRACITAQILFYFYISIYGYIRYIFFPSMTLMEVFLLKIKLPIMVYLILMCRMVSYKNLFITSTLKNNIYIFSSILFYMIVFASLMSLNPDISQFKIEDKAMSLNNFYVFIDILNSKTVFISEWPEFFNFLFVVSSIIILVILDYIEKRSKVTKRFTRILFFSIIADITYILPRVEIGNVVVGKIYDFIMFISYFLISTIVVCSEIEGALAKTKNVTVDIEMIKKIIKQARKEYKKNKKFSKKTKLQAKIIQDMIRQNPKLSNDIPWTKKDIDLINLVGLQP